MMTTLPEEDEILDALRSGLAKLLSPEDLAHVDLPGIDRNTPFLSLPIDSAVLMALMAELEETFTVFVDDESAFAFTAVGDVSDYIRHRLAEKARRLGQR